MNYVSRDLTDEEIAKMYESTDLYRFGLNFLLKKGYIELEQEYDGCYIHKINHKAELLCRIKESEEM